MTRKTKLRILAGVVSVPFILGVLVMLSPILIVVGVCHLAAFAWTGEWSDGKTTW